MLAYSLVRSLRRPVALDLACAYAIRTQIRPFADLSGGPTISYEKQVKNSRKPTIRKVKLKSPVYAFTPQERQFQKHLKARMSTSGEQPYNNLTYYTFGTPNGLKPAIVLEELGLQYEAVTVDITKNTQKEDWFLAINPNGRIPALKNGDLRVFESGAIMLYLVDNFDGSEKISYKYGTPLYYEMLSWLMFQMGGIGPMQGQANHFLAMAGARSDYSIKRYLDETKRLYGVLESRLSKADWLAGDKYTIADIANYSWVRSGPILLDIDLSQWPGVDRWVKRIGARPAVEKAKKVPPSTRTPEEMKEMFSEMRAKVQAMENTDKH